MQGTSTMKRSIGVTWDVSENFDNNIKNISSTGYSADINIGVLSGLSDREKYYKSISKVIR
jgi:hypothetical protein